MKSNKREAEIFNYLDKSCGPDSTPIPNSLFNPSLKTEIYGFIVWIISVAFENMRQSDGNSNWECDAKVTLGSRRCMTMNALRKYVMEAQGSGLIEYAKEVGDEIIVKVNVLKLFSDVPQGAE